MSTSTRGPKIDVWPLWLLAITLMLSGGSPAGLGAPEASGSRYLILHDGTGEYSWVGELHAIMLTNLLGHFPVSYQIGRSENYISGDLAAYDGLFYLGNTFDQPLPTALLREVRATTKTVCWFRYNLWQLHSTNAALVSFETQYGFRYEAIDTSGYNNVH